MNFVNFWMRDIVLPLGATACPLDLPDGEYRLVIADGLGQQATTWEIVGAVVAAGAATLTRGLEGTTVQAWPAGSVIYSSVTAGVLQALADNSGGGGSDDTIIEHITTDVHLRFFGKPTSAPSRLGQVCRQIEVNGQVCWWVAYKAWDESLQWRRSVLPLADWGTSVPDTSSMSLSGSERALAMTKDAFVEAPIVTTLLLPALVSGDGGEPLPLVIANWSAQTWTINLDPAAFWVSGGRIALDRSGLDAMGITLSQSGPDNSVVSFVVPANTRAWVDLTVNAGVYEGEFGMYCQLIARPINLSIV